MLVFRPFFKLSFTGWIFSIILSTIVLFHGGIAFGQNTKGDRPAPVQRPAVEKGSSQRLFGKRIKPISRGQIRSTPSRPIESNRSPFVNNPSRKPSAGDRPSVSPRRVKTPASASRSGEVSIPGYNPYVNNPSYSPSKSDQPYRGRTASGKRLVTRRPENRSVNIYEMSGPKIRKAPPEPSPSERSWTENRTASGKKIVERKPTQSSQNIYERRGKGSNRPLTDTKISERKSLRPDLPPRTVRSSDGTVVTRTRLAAQSISSTFLTPRKNNVYWGKFSPNRERITTDMYGRPLRRLDYRSAVKEIVPGDTLPNVDRQTRRELPSYAKTPGARSITRTGMAWQGDISGKKLRESSRDPRRAGRAEAGKLLFNQPKFPGSGTKSSPRSSGDLANLGGRGTSPRLATNQMKMISGTASMMRKGVARSNQAALGLSRQMRKPGALNLTGIKSPSKGRLSAASFAFKKQASYSGQSSLSRRGIADKQRFSELSEARSFKGKNAKGSIASLSAQGKVRSQKIKIPSPSQQKRVWDIQAYSGGNFGAVGSPWSYQKPSVTQRYENAALRNASARRNNNLERTGHRFGKPGEDRFNRFPANKNQVSSSGISDGSFRRVFGQYRPFEASPVMGSTFGGYQIRTGKDGKPTSRQDVRIQASQRQFKYRSGFQLARGIKRSPMEIRQRGVDVRRANVGGFHQLNLSKYGSQAGSSLGIDVPFGFAVRGKPKSLNVWSEKNVYNRADVGGISAQVRMYSSFDRRRSTMVASGYRGDLKLGEPSQQDLIKKSGGVVTKGRRLSIDQVPKYVDRTPGPVDKRKLDQAGMYFLRSGSQPTSFSVDRVRVNPFRNPYVHHPEADPRALKKSRPDPDWYAVNGLQMKKPSSPQRANVERTEMNFRVWSIDQSRVALTTGLTGKVVQGRYVHHPNSSREALKVLEPNKAFLRTGLVQANTRMRKYEAPALHPDARFVHLREDNVEGERTLFTSIRMVFDKKFKRNDLQPANVKEKIRRPRYDPKEVGLWYD